MAYLGSENAGSARETTCENSSGGTVSWRWDEKAFDRTAFHRKGFEKPPCDFLPTQKPPASAIRGRAFGCCKVFWKPSSPIILYIPYFNRFRKRSLGEGVSWGFLFFYVLAISAEIW
jgi:hypothetical protein